MKKILIIVGLAIGGCQSPQTLVVKSDLVVANEDHTKLWIKDSDPGRSLYTLWKKGVYGDTVEVYLLDSTRFDRLKTRGKNPTVSL